MSESTSRTSPRRPAAGRRGKPFPQRAAAAALCVFRRYEMYATQIQTGELRETDLPNGYGEWSDYAKFAVTFAPRDRDLCSEADSVAFARWRRTGDVPRTLEELRACLWYEQRRWRILGHEPDTAAPGYIWAPLRAERQ